MVTIDETVPFHSNEDTSNVLGWLKTNSQKGVVYLNHSSEYDVREGEDRAQRLVFSIHKKNGGDKVAEIIVTFR